MSATDTAIVVVGKGAPVVTTSDAAHQIARHYTPADTQQWRTWAEWSKS